MAVLGAYLICLSCTGNAVEATVDMVTFVAVETAFAGNENLSAVLLAGSLRVVLAAVFGVNVTEAAAVAVTVNLSVAVIVPEVAVILVEPAATLVALPAAEIVATEALDELQVTVEVKSFVVESE